MKYSIELQYTDYLKIQQILEDYEDLMDLREAKKKTINEPSIPFNKIEGKIRKDSKK